MSADNQPRSTALNQCVGLQTCD